MAKQIHLNPQGLKKLRTIDLRMLSYNVEMTEVTGGTFWKPYTKEQIEGTEEFPLLDMSQMAGLMSVFPPIDLYNRKLRRLAKALGPVYIRVSGSWATNTYYDFDGHTEGMPPEGFRAVLTKKQWDGVLDFAKEVDGRILVSMANVDAVHDADGTWNPEQAKLLFDYSRDYGVPIYAAEFMNESNFFPLGKDPSNYSVERYAADQDAFFRFIRENYPDVKLVGPCVTGDKISESATQLPGMPSSESILQCLKEPADVFSYHAYAGVSERGAFFGGHWKADQALTEEYLAMASLSCGYYGKLRDKYCPGAPMWVTESADAGCGGNTWGSTYLDVIRYADELGSFCSMTDGAIFHNTLASSDYGFLDHATHNPRPNYWLALLWNQLMGTTVYDAGEEKREGVHCYAHSRRDGKDGTAYLVINNSRTESTVAELPSGALVYELSADTLRADTMRLNGAPLVLAADGSLPELLPKAVDGTLELKPATLAFIIV